MWFDFPNDKDLLERLQRLVDFPRHGWAEDVDGATYVVLPIFRAIGEQLAPSAAGRSTYRARVLSSLFSLCWRRIFRVLHQIDHCERTLVTGKMHWEGQAEPTPVDELRPELEAQWMLPLYGEWFYTYVRLLADRLRDSLVAHLTTRQPRGLSVGYKGLLAYAEKGAVHQEDWRANPDGVLQSVRENSEWYRRLVNQAGRAGLRDSIFHRPISFQVLYHEEAGSRGVTVCFQAFGVESRDVPKEVDLIATIRDVLDGICTLLSALPPNIWAEPRWHPGDLAVLRGAPGSLGGVRRFLPAVYTPTLDQRPH